MRSKPIHRGALGLLTAALVVTTGVTAAALPATAAPAAPRERGQVTQLIVKYEPGVAPQESDGKVTGEDRLDDTEKGLRQGQDIGFGYRTVVLPRGTDEATAEGLSRKMESSAKVSFAAPDGVVTALDVQSSPPSWGLDRIDQSALPLNGAYSYADTGSGVTAYIVDTGIRSTHVDLAGRVSTGDDEVKDGNGTEDCNGHGTHVSGTVGGTAYGVAKGVQLVPVRVLGCSGSGSTSGVIAGLSWVAAHHAAGVPAVLNLSLGGTFSQPMNDAVAAVVADGVVVAVASGNSNLNACTTSPASSPTAITVNATGDYAAFGAGGSAISDIRATFSNYGSCTDIYAPGVGITSSWMSSDTATSSISGTSMATPHVAGAAARILQANPGWSPAQVWAEMSGTALPYTPYVTGDAAKLLYLAGLPVAATSPSAPMSVKATAANAALTGSWSAPLTTGGSAITYSATLFDAQAGGAQIGSACTTSALTCTFTGLVNGTTYWLEVSAANATGTGPAAARVSGTPSTPATVPAAPTLVSAARSASGSVAVNWAAGSNGGSAITGFTARAFTSATGTTVSRSCAGAAAATSCTITGLTNGASYYIDVVASNAVGTGKASTRSSAVVPYTTPGTPRSVSARAAVKAATIKWLAPTSTGGSAITGYVATAYSAASGGTVVSTCSTSASVLTCSIPGLTTGTTYYVSVAARNAGGTGTSSSRVSVRAN